MRIGTWNLAGRWGPRHLRLLERAACDVWLLTEVHDRVKLEGYSAQTTASPMRKGVAWASVLSRSPQEPVAEPHPASGAARMNGIVFCCSILPWRSCGSGAPWQGATHLDRTKAAVDDITAALPSGPLIWGGDWNHALVGTEHAGSLAGRARIDDALSRSQLWAPTRELPHRIPGLLSIDHIAIPEGVRATATRVSADADGVRLSDHDLYVVECADAELAALSAGDLGRPSSA